ncbi:MAG: PorT family protein [Maribacter sp.]|nr:PorT family protein [Maribacter sp.]
MGKKNIDQLFQEKFQNFSELPDEKVWENIKSSLDKKKKSRKIIPLWWKFGGIAALLAVALLLFNPLGVGLDNDQITPGVQNASDTKSSNGIVNENGPETLTEGQNALTKTPPEPNKSEEARPTNALSTKEVLNNLGSKRNTEKVSLQKNNEETKVAANPSDIRPRIEKQDDTFGSNIHEIAKDRSPSTVAGLKEQQNDHNLPVQNNTEEIGLTDDRQSLYDPEGGIAQSEEGSLNENKNAPLNKSIFDEIEQKGEDTIGTEDVVHRWSVGANIAPVYFNAIGEGSPIHSSFAPNAKTGEINLSYGLSVAYEISKKLKIRSGINKVDFGYDTNDVEFSSSFTASANGQIPNIDYKVTSENLFVASKTSANALKNDLAFDASSIDASRDGVMTQRFGYLEIPLELNYSIIDKRFGVDVVGGLSSLFLVDNSVALTSGNLATEIGTANNLNEVNFSTNIGFGLNYKFSPKVHLNIEPVFKYQLNTFSNTAGSFQPFSMGIYSGLNFKF